MISKLGALTISLLQEFSSMVWMVRETASEIMERIAKHRTPFRLEHFFYQSNRVGVGSVPMVILLSVFIGLTMALLGCATVADIDPGLVELPRAWSPPGD